VFIMILNQLFSYKIKGSLTPASLLVSHEKIKDKIKRREVLR
jgi:hypothetical protein